jgi:pyrroline-5-carboxylate reductase
MENIKIAILGSGSMGTAIASGLIAAGASPANIKASTATTESAEALKAKFSISALSLEHSASANAEQAKDADVVLIAVKPAKVIDTLVEIKGKSKPVL